MLVKLVTGWALRTATTLGSQLGQSSPEAQRRDVCHARAIATVRYSVNNMHICHPHLKSCVESFLLFPDYGYDTGTPTGRVLMMYAVHFRC